MIVWTVLLLSVGIQIAAAIRALLFIRVTGRRWGWVFLSVAFLAMAARRFLSASDIIGTGGRGVTTFDILGLATSAILLAGLSRIGDLFDALSKVEANLRVRENRYKSLLHQSTEGIALIDTETLAVQEVNDRFLDLAGVLRREKALPSLDVLLPTMDGNPVGMLARQAANSHTPIHAEYEVRRAGGRVLDLSISCSLIQLGTGKVVLFSARDISERKRTERVLALRQETDRRILRHEPLTDIYRGLTSGITRRLGFPLAWIGLRTENGSIDVVAGADASGQALPPDQIASKTSQNFLFPAMRALSTKRIQTGTDSRNPDVPDDGSALFPQYVSIPLTVDGKVFGALSIYSKDPAAFDTNEIALLSRFADQLAFAVTDSEQRERLALQTTALQSTANAVCVTDSEGCIEWVNHAFTQLTGYRLDEVSGRSLSVLKSNAHPENLYAQMWKTIESGEVWRGEIFNRKKDGSIYAEEQTITPVRGADGRIKNYVAVKQDVSARNQSETLIRRLAERDALTDVPARREAVASLSRAVEQAAEGIPSTLVLFDVDHFALVNNSFGSLAGDQVLSEVVKLARQALNGSGELFRLGGDMFMVLLVRLPVAAGYKAAEGIRCAIKGHHFEPLEGIFDLTVSGAVVAIDGRYTSAVLLSLAEAKMQEAKERGRNQVVVADHTTPEIALTTRSGRWAARIKAALRQDRFALFLQPIVRLSDSQTVHHEALVRMFDEDGLVVLPGEFLPPAARFGLISQIDLWVLKRTLHLLSDSSELEIFVNLSGESLGDSRLLAEMEEMVRASGIPAGRLAFEITESSAVHDVLGARAWMHRIKELGCRFALDDFGIGFSSFSYLQTFPADFVKIDGSFIRGLESNRTNRAIVQAIVTVAHTLGKETIAEWVETPLVAKTLRELGVEYGQGNTFGRPVPSRTPGSLVASDSGGRGDASMTRDSCLCSEVTA